MIEVEHKCIHKISKSVFLSFLITICFAAFLPIKASCSEKSINKYAIIVGINDYENTSVNPLHFAVNDAKEMKRILIEKMGFTDDSVYLFTSDKKGEAEPKLSNITFALDSVKDDIKPGGTFVFFFSGHGIDMEGESFLLTREADPRSRGTLEVTSLKVARVKDTISKMKADRILLFIDACRTDPGSNKGSESNSMTKSFSKNLIISQCAKPDKGSGKVHATLFSCSIGESSYEWAEKKQGFFTYYLLKGIEGEAADRNGDITLNNLEIYLTSSVSKSANKWMGKPQTPWMERSGSGAGTLALAKGKPLTATDLNASSGSNSLKPNSTGNTDNSQAYLPLPADPFDAILFCIDNDRKKDIEDLIRKNPGLINKTKQIDLFENNKSSEMVISPLRKASRTGKKDIVEFLISNGANVKVKYENGNEALHSACSNGHTEVAALLIENGANVNAKAEDGWTPLLSAASCGNIDTIKLLLSKGADINAKDNKGSSPIYASSHNNHKKAVEFLISKGADVNIRNCDFCTPLFSAIEARSVPIAELLLSKGADINAKNAFGQTPLHQAVILGKMQFVEFFISKGADINAKDNEKRTPLFCAINKGFKEIADLLRKNGARE